MARGTMTTAQVRSSATSTACHSITLHVATSVTEFDNDAYCVDTVPDPSTGSFRLTGGAGLSPCSLLEVHDLAGHVFARSTFAGSKTEGYGHDDATGGGPSTAYTTAAHRSRIVIVH